MNFYNKFIWNFNIKKLCFLYPTNNIIKYDKPVSGNKIQELQFKKIFYLIKPWYKLLFT